ncbi:helix-turn-helix domain-containing protein [Rhodanobacter sp. UC4452_H20]
MPVSGSELMSADTICRCVSSSFFTEALPDGQPSSGHFTPPGIQGLLAAPPANRTDGNRRRQALPYPARRGRAPVGPAHVPWALPQPIAELAALAAMSERSFMRHFRQATGTSPVHWLIGARVDRARELLESSTLSIDAIAGQCGFGSAITLRHHFRRKLAISPAAYRSRFAQTRRG